MGLFLCKYIFIIAVKRKSYVGINKTIILKHCKKRWNVNLFLYLALYDPIGTWKYTSLVVMGVCLLFFTYMRYPLSQTWKVWIILTSFKQLACKGNPYLWDKASLLHIFVSFELIKISVAYICEVYGYFVISCCKTYNPC